MDKLVRFDNALAMLTSGLASVRERMNALDYKAPGVEFEIQKLAAKSKQALDLSKDRRDRESEAHAAALAEVKMRWRPVIDGFDEMVKSLKERIAQVMGRLRAEQEAARKEAEEKLAAARAKEASIEPGEDGKRAALKDLRQARSAVDALAPAGAPIGIKTDNGSISERKVWSWEITNADEVPDTYIERYIDPKKVDLAVRNGVREIAGIRIFEKPIIALRANPSRRR